MEEKKDVKKEAIENVKAKTTIELPIPLAQEILDYLQRRPWAEVNAIISKLIEASKR